MADKGGSSWADLEGLLRGRWREAPERGGSWRAKLEVILAGRRREIGGS